MVDDTELEEGESGTFREEIDQDIDPDVDFNYIGEKLHDLLGHHLREFEGCFTAENLGPKFGAYGSFLPTVQRAPSSLHPTTPRVQVQNNLPKTIIGSLYGCIAIPSTASQKQQHELGSATVSKLPSVLPTVKDSVSKAASFKPTQVSEINTKPKDAKQLHTVIPNNVNESVEEDASMNATHTEGINAESGNSKQSIKLAGRKPIRVRITMNSKKLLPQNNAASISGPGPNAGLLESNTAKGKRVALESQDNLPKSPNDIIRIMTDSPVPRSSVLSPLPDYVTYLMRNEKKQKDCSFNGDHPLKEDSPDSRSNDKNVKRNKKKPHPTASESAEELDRVLQTSMATNRRVGNGNMDLYGCEGEQPGFVPSQLVGTFNKKQNGTDIKCDEKSYRISVCDEAQGPSKDDMHFSGLKVNEAVSHERDALKTSSVVLEGGKRSEECSIQRIAFPYLSKGNQIVRIPLKPGNMHRISGLNNNLKSENMNLQRGLEKTKDTYKDIFGDLSTDDEENESVYLEASSECVNKKTKVVYNKKTPAPIHKPKVKESRKKRNESVSKDGCTAVGSSAFVPLDNHDADISVAAAPIPIQENWVFCDRCNKWRLLPLNVDTNSLPDKWTCRMINWLRPGMNHCKVSEEDTTKAVHALYESSVPENHVEADVVLHGITSGVCASNTELPEQTLSSLSGPVAMKKKHGSAKMSESIDLQCTAKSQQSKPSEFGTERNRVKMPKKFLPYEGVTNENQRTENTRQIYHGRPRASDVLHTENMVDQVNLPCENSKTKNNLLQLSAKRTNAKLRVSSDDSSLEMQIVDGQRLPNNKRKAREHSESSLIAQVNQVSHGAFSQDDHRRKKRMRLKQSRLNGFISSECNDRHVEKVHTENVSKSAKGLGTNVSKMNIYEVHPGKNKFGSLKNIAPESSSSKISSSQKSKMEIEGVKASPVGSVSSSPLCLPKNDKRMLRKRNSFRQDGMVDMFLFEKIEDGSLQSVDKSNSSCTISGSKEDVCSGEKRRDKNNKVLVNNAVRSCKRDTDALISSESSKWTDHHKPVGNEVQADLLSSEQALSKQTVGGGSQSKLVAENNQLDIASGIDKLLSGKVFDGHEHDDNTICSSQDAPISQHINDFRSTTVPATNDNYVKGACLMMKSGDQRVNQLASTDFGEENLSTIRKGLPNEAIFIEKEARSLKYMADRFGESVSACEKVGIYFQSALKFLNAASLYESSCCESAKLDVRNRTMQIYRSTTKLFEFCAAEFEKANNMCAVALAYKCMEVACLRVVYYSHSSASKDLHELHAMVPPGESPSPCFSGVDNLNNVATVDQDSLTKGVGSPLVTEGLIIPAHSRPNLIQLFTFTEDVDTAMDSSQKSWTAFMAANANPVNAQGISLVKKALDFSFQDVDEFLRLVRFAMDGINS
ncbi:unnamed protein product [Rhodiola kirilowii]